MVDWFGWMMANEFFGGLIIGKEDGSLLQGNVEVLENLSREKEWRFWENLIDLKSCDWNNWRIFFRSPMVNLELVNLEEII